MFYAYIFRHANYFIGWIIFVVELNFLTSEESNPLTINCLLLGSSYSCCTFFISLYSSKTFFISLQQIHFQEFLEVFEVKFNNGFITECSNSRDWWWQWDDNLSNQWYGSYSCCGRSKAEPEPGHQLYSENFGPSSPALPYCLFLQCCLSASSSPSPVFFSCPICYN